MNHAEKLVVGRIELSRNRETEHGSSFWDHVERISVQQKTRPHKTDASLPISIGEAQRLLNLVVQEPADPATRDVIDRLRSFVDAQG